MEPFCMHVEGVHDGWTTKTPLAFLSAFLVLLVMPLLTVLGLAALGLASRFGLGPLASASETIPEL